MLLTPDCFDIDRNEYFEGAPTVVVEIRSPGDETMEKLPFYAQIGVPEVWVIDRDTKESTLNCLHSGEYKKNPQNKTDGCTVQQPASVFDMNRPIRLRFKWAKISPRGAFCRNSHRSLNFHCVADPPK